MGKHQSTWFLFAAVGVVLLLALDLLNKGLVWQALRSLRSENTASLPGEDRAIGEKHRANVTFLS